MKCYWLFVLLTACTTAHQVEQDVAVTPNRIPETQELAETSLVILGTTQDAGSPHIGCEKFCCANVTEKRMVVSLGLVDVEQQASYLFDATPDITAQLRMLAEYAPYGNRKTSDGVFITHAHIGHYTGLMYYGREALGGDSVPVFAMPRMKQFIERDGPWSQLVSNGNIAIHELHNQAPIQLNAKLEVVPFTVPHRDEYSETVGYKIIGPQKTALFIPDIDKWERWETRIETLLEEVDYAFLDGTFFHNDELGHRDMSEVPHPFVLKSLDRFGSLPKEERNKIYFIHFNHTNPLLNPNSPQYELVHQEGFHVANLGDVFSLE